MLEENSKIEKIVEGCELFRGDCIQMMTRMKEVGIQVDLTVTSPPYDDLRSYEGIEPWTFEKFKQVANLLYDITRGGGCSLGCFRPDGKGGQNAYLVQTGLVFPGNRFQFL